MSLLNYQDFLFETYGKIKLSEARENLLRTISKSYLLEEEQYVLDFVIQEGLTNDFFSLYESNDDIIQENFIQKAKERYDRAKEEIKSRGKEALDKMSDATKNLVQVGGNILKPIKTIMQKIGEAIKKAWEEAKAIANEAVNKYKDKISEKIKNLIKDSDKKKKLKDELKNLGEMISAGTKYITSGFSTDAEKAAAAAASSDDKNESFLNYIEYAILNEITSEINKGVNIDDIIESLNEEGHGHEKKGGLNIPFVSKVMSKIGHMPPFKYFHDLGAKAEDFTNNKLSRASFLVNKVADGPAPYEYVVFGSLVGVAVGYYTETFAKTGALGILAEFGIPGLVILKSLIGGIGLALAIYGIAESLVGSEGEEKKEEEKEEDEKKEEE